MAASHPSPPPAIRILLDSLFPLREGIIMPEICKGIVSDFFVKTFCECWEIGNFYENFSFFSIASFPCQSHPSGKNLQFRNGE